MADSVISYTVLPGGKVHSRRPLPIEATRESEILGEALLAARTGEIPESVDRSGWSYELVGSLFEGAMIVTVSADQGRPVLVFLLLSGDDLAQETTLLTQLASVGAPPRAAQVVDLAAAISERPAVVSLVLTVGLESYATGRLVTILTGAVFDLRTDGSVHE